VVVGVFGSTENEMPIPGGKDEWMRKKYGAYNSRQEMLEHMTPEARAWFYEREQREQEQSKAEPKAEARAAPKKGER
jgi:hypothetical protein